MPLSAKKKAKLEKVERMKKIDALSLNGKGYFMDAAHDSDARRYIETGDEKYLKHLPDYRKIRPRRVSPLAKA